MSDQNWIPSDDTAVSSGGTSQEIFAANERRRGLIVQNLSSGDLWVNFGVAAVADAPSLRVPAGYLLTLSGNDADTRAVHLLGATTGQKFTAKEI